MKEWKLCPPLSAVRTRKNEDTLWRYIVSCDVAHRPRQNAATLLRGSWTQEMFLKIFRNTFCVLVLPAPNSLKNRFTFSAIDVRATSPWRQSWNGRLQLKAENWGISDRRRLVTVLIQSNSLKVAPFDLSVSNYKLGSIIGGYWSKHEDKLHW